MRSERREVSYTDNILDGFCGLLRELCHEVLCLSSELFVRSGDGCRRRIAARLRSAQKHADVESLKTKYYEQLKS